MSKEKKFECKVIRNGFIVEGEELEIGTLLQMTERQIKGFVGKVKLTKEIAKDEADEEKSLKGIGKLKELNEALEAKVDKLEEVLGEKTMEVSKLVAELAAAKKK